MEDVGNVVVKAVMFLACSISIVKTADNRTELGWFLAKCSIEQASYVADDLQTGL